MTGLWSDYELKLCRVCGHKMLHEKGATKCRDCELPRLGR